MQSKRIKLSYYFANDPLLRQTESGSGVWKGDTFVANDPGCRECDIWVVLEDPEDDEERAVVRSGRVVLITMEPPQIRTYSRDFLSQFDLVLTAHRGLAHSNVRVEYQGLPWHFGLSRGTGASSRPMSYDDLVRLTPPRKTADLSVICSKKSRLKGHRLRQQFVEKLQARLGARVDVFGRGVRPISDKADAIIPYRYHIVLENSRLPDYWTEKLSDSYLGWSFPIYWGCENIRDYLPENSFIEIDISRADDAISMIEAVMGQELTPDRRAGLADARALVLDRYNTFDVIRRACESLTRGPAGERTIRSQRMLRPSRIRRLISRTMKKFSFPSHPG